MEISLKLGTSTTGYQLTWQWNFGTNTCHPRVHGKMSHSPPGILRVERIIPIGGAMDSKCQGIHFIVLHPLSLVAEAIVIGMITIGNANASYQHRRRRTFKCCRILYTLFKLSRFTYRDYILYCCNVVIYCHSSTLYFICITRSIFCFWDDIENTGKSSLFDY